MSAGSKKRAGGGIHGLFALAISALRSATIVWRLAIAASAAAIVIAVALGIWQNVRPHVESQPEYLVAPAAIELTGAPRWIRVDVRAEVLRDAGLTQPLSVLDPHLAQRLTQAFALHPWIARVAGVKTSYPAHIQIDVEYRKPAAMVQVHGGLLPIDSGGVLLPTEDFSPQEAQRYPRICGVGSSPLGPLGTPWGDPVLEAAAKLAALLQSDWQQLQLHHLGPTESSSAHQIILILATRGGTEFVWGSAPGEETAEEPKAAEKLAALKQMAAETNSLDEVGQEQRDLRRQVQRDSVPRQRIGITPTQ